MDYKQKNKDKKLLHVLHLIDRDQQKLKSIIISLIPENIRQAIVFCHYQKRILTILVNTPVVTTQLRFLMPNLQAQLKKHQQLTHLKQIKIETTNIDISSQKSSSKNLRALPGVESANIIADMAYTLKDKKLKDSLLALSSVIINKQPNAECLKELSDK